MTFESHHCQQVLIIHVQGNHLILTEFPNMSGLIQITALILHRPIIVHHALVPIIHPPYIGITKQIGGHIHPSLALYHSEQWIHHKAFFPLQHYLHHLGLPT